MTNDSLSAIKKENPNGTLSDFVNENERDTYIKNHFQNQFSQPANDQSTLNDFLGEHINNPIFQQHKLTDLEKESIDGPITMEELQESLDSANMQSAMGIDGFPMKAIQAFWPLLKLITLRGFNVISVKKQLIGAMKNSKIRLLRKGEKNPALPKNWRPISLLTSLYKLYSGERFF